MRRWDRETGLRFMAAGGIALIAGWVFHSRAIVPLRQKEAESQLAAAELKALIDGARNAVAQIRQEEQAADQAGREPDRSQADLPQGSAIVWLPRLAKEHFQRAGLAAPGVRLHAIREVPDAPGCERGLWSIRLPIDEAGRSVPALLLAVADLDQQHPFLGILDFSIQPDPEHRVERVAVIDVGFLSRKTGDSR